MDANNLDAFGSNDGGRQVAAVIGSSIVSFFRVNGSALCPAFPLPSGLRPVALQYAYPGEISSWTDPGFLP